MLERLLDLSHWELAWWSHVGRDDKSCLQWHQLVWRHSGKDYVKKSWAVVFFSLRNLFIWANILCISFYSFDHGCNLLTYVTDSLLRRGQSPAQTISLVFSVLCFVSVCLHWYRYTSFAHRMYVCAYACIYVREEEDLMCNMRKEGIPYLFRHMHPNKGEVNVSGIPHKTRSTKSYGENLAEPSTHSTLMSRKCWGIPREHCSSIMTVIYHKRALFVHIW